MNGDEYTAFVNEARGMNVKHWHRWEVAYTSIGRNSNGMGSRCACGAKKWSGARDDTLVSDYTPRPQLSNDSQSDPGKPQT